MEHSPRLGPPANHQPASSPGDAEKLNLGAARIEWLRQKQRHRAVAHCVLPVAVLGGEREVDHPWTHRYLRWRPKRGWSGTPGAAAWTIRLISLTLAIFDNLGNCSATCCSES